jgi:dTDP-4-amino-4,6-dideoxygalactose transaminase
MSARPIPLIDLKAQYAGIRDEIEAAIHRVVETQTFVMGPEVEAFETEFPAYCQSRFAVGCGSGTDALSLALMALDLKAGDEVICPAYSFVATASCLVRLGLKVVFADIDPVTHNLCPESARRAAERCTRLKALIPVDLFGQVCDAQALAELATEFDIPIIEDAAQAVGAEDAQGRRAGALATLGCFSLYPSKNLGAYGDAGVVITSHEHLAERLRGLRSHGASHSRYIHEEIGINSRLDGIQAAILRVKLRHLESWTKRRRENASFYDQAFAAAGAGASGSHIEDARLPLLTPAAQPGARHVYHQYVVRVRSNQRDGLRAHLAEQAISSEIYYPLGLHQQPCFADLGYRNGAFPETEAAALETLALPIYPELPRSDLARIVDACAQFLSPS